MATLKDVALEAGVSPTAVSRHLNGRIVLPRDTRDRIDAAIARLNYRPNPAAKRLSTGRSEALGLVTPEISNPFFGELAAVFEGEAARHGYSVYFSSTGGKPELEISAISRLRDGHVDGMVLLTNRVDDGTLLKRLEGLKNVVLVDEDVTGAALPRIFVENAAGARMGTEHLIDLGHRDIALVCGPAGVMTAREREAGWHSALEAAGLPPGRVLNGEYTRAYGQEAASRLIVEGLPTAVMVCADEVAVGMLEVFRAQGVRVPEDISIVGFDDMRYAALVHPPLTTVRQPVAELGRLAFETLRDLMEGRAVAPLTRMPVTLQLRSSTAAPRKKDRT